MGLLAKILSDSEQYNAYYSVLEQSVYKVCEKADPIIVEDLLNLCKTHNYLRNCLLGDYSTEKEIKVSKKTVTLLEKLSYVDGAVEDCKINLHMDDKYEAIIRDFLSNRELSLMNLSQFLLSFPGRFLMKPDTNRVGY
jgi:hypothetical protein